MDVQSIRILSHIINIKAFQEILFLISSKVYLWTKQFTFVLICTGTQMVHQNGSFHIQEFGTGSSPR
jgi:hypothetical protein